MNKTSRKSSPIGSVLSAVLVFAARASCHLPKGRSTAALALLRLASKNEFTPSVYGPLLRSRWHDATFRFCVSGMYGYGFSTLLSKIDFPFSFIDIGSNAGLYSLIAASNRHCGACYAFEPNPHVYRDLLDNISINDVRNIDAYNVAVSDKVGSLLFVAPTHHSGVGHIISHSVDATDAIKVQSVNHHFFDSLAAKDLRPKIIKIDVEGDEPCVISQLIQSKLLFRQVTYLYFEANSARYDVTAIMHNLELLGLTFVDKFDQGDDTNILFKTKNCSARKTHTATP